MVQIPGLNFRCSTFIYPKADFFRIPFFNPQPVKRHWAARRSTKILSMSSQSTKVTRRKRDRINENFSKRVKSLLEKSNGLTEYNTDVYLLIRRHGKLCEYNSIDCKCWPLSRNAIVSTLTQYNMQLILIIHKEVYYPVPIRKSQKDYKNKKGNCQAGSPNENLASKDHQEC